MKSQLPESTALPSWMRSWERFWFTPADPTVLGLIRICCGLITLYTFIIYSFTLQETMGEDGWVDLKLRQTLAHDRAIPAMPLQGSPPTVAPSTPDEKNALEEYRRVFKMDARMFGLPPPKDRQQLDYLVEYTRRFKQPPPAYAESQAEADKIARYRELIKQNENGPFYPDPRILGLKWPQTTEQWDYLVEYSKKWGHPPPAYATSKEEAEQIDDYIKREKVDPRALYTRGMPIWSIWMHVTDPTAMGFVQGAFILVALLMTIGLGTRITAPLTWVASICYIHRNTQIMFGTDTMMNILLLYLSIGPSGAAVSLDGWLARWWRGGTTPSLPPEPRVSANVVIRMLQIHICIIYLIAGLSKLQGTSWWTGTALWGVMGNFEFAPMHFAIYNDFLRWLGRDQFRYELFMTTGCFFTLAFEITYVFLVWWPRTRWVVLGGALLLHGTIAVFMGLKTFSLIMLVMNMAFLRPDEVHWLLRWLPGPAAAKPPAPAPALQPVAAGSTYVTKK